MIRKKWLTKNVQNTTSYAARIITEYKHSVLEYLVEYSQPIEVKVQLPWRDSINNDFQLNSKKEELKYALDFSKFRVLITNSLPLYVIFNLIIYPKYYLDWVKKLSLDNDDWKNLNMATSVQDTL